ncbi:MAG: deoxynucleoside kinase [Candidatus Binatia bacterium]|nr:deoxynucleoside kinase [Candidatus Binatia bacterium]
MGNLRYIAVEGPIGAGKTTLANLLAAEFGARAVLEQVEENPFLRRFYEDPRAWAFQTQLFFLLSRYRQQSLLRQQELFDAGVVSDYLFAKDQIFAHVNLKGEELSLYRQIYHLLDSRLPKPDLVVYLHARPEILIERLRKRDRDYERRIPREYIEALAAAYRNFFFDYNETALLVADVSAVDFVNSRDDFVDLVREIRSMGKGVQHYIPLGSR